MNEDTDRKCIVFVENEGTVHGNYTLQQDLELKEEQSLNIPDETSLIMGSYQLTGDGYLKGYIPESWKGRVEVTLYSDDEKLNPEKPVILKTGDNLPSFEEYKKGNHKCKGWSLTAGDEVAEMYQVRYGKDLNNLYLKWEPKKKLTAEDFVFKKPEGLVYDYYLSIAPPVSLKELEGVGPVRCDYEYYYEEWERWDECYFIENAGTYRVLVSVDESEDYQSMREELVDESWVFTVAPKDIKVTPDAEQVFFEGGKEAKIDYEVENNVSCEGTLELKRKANGEGYQYDMGSLKVDYWYERNYKLKLEDVEVTVYECLPNEVEATIASDNATEYGWANGEIVLSAPKGFVFADDNSVSKQFGAEGSYSLKLKKGDDVTTYEHPLPIDKTNPVVGTVTTNNLSFTIEATDKPSGIASVMLGDMVVEQVAEGVYSGTANAGTHTITVTDRAGNSVTTSVTLEAELFDIILKEVSGGKIYADKSEATAGETITLRYEEHNNYDFVRWEVKKTGSGEVVQVDGNTFKMPAAAVTVSAVFRYDPPYVPPVDPTYYDIHFEANDSVLLSSDRETVEAGHSLTITAEAAEGYDPATLVVEYRSGRYGSWRTLAPDNNGDYRIASVYNDIYIRARIERLEDPTANEQVDAATSRVWVTGSRLCITLTEPQKLHIVSMEGRLLRTEQLPVGYSEITGLPAGVHIVLLSDGLRKKVVIR